MSNPIDYSDRNIPSITLEKTPYHTHIHRQHTFHCYLCINALLAALRSQTYLIHSSSLSISSLFTTSFFFSFIYSIKFLYVMGAKLTKSKSLSISGKVNERTKSDNLQLSKIRNNHLNKNIKKKDEKSKKKSSQTKVDKSTNTDNCVLPTSSFTEQLVGEQMPVITNHLSLDNTFVAEQCTLSIRRNKQRCT